MVINILQDILSRCHERHENPLKQKKTISVPALYKGLPYNFTVNCAHKYPVLLRDMELAGISFMPIGQAPGNDRPPRYFGGERFLKRQQTTDWETVLWHRSWGIHIYTGKPSERDSAPWHDINFKYEALCVAPEAVMACVQALVDSVANPLLTMSKSGGLRFSCRIPDYLHPNTNHARYYVYKHTQIAEESKPIEAYIEILGEKGYNCWDARYEILHGDLLEPPLVSKEVFFAPIDALRATLHEPIPDSTQYQESIRATPLTLGSCKLELAKEAFLKRGFAYIREENGRHYWSDTNGTGSIEVLLWEKDGGVWMCASTSDTGLPNEATLITDVWHNTGILPPLPATGLPLNEKTIMIREGERSPLAIKRPTPILQKSKLTEKTHETYEEIRGKIQSAFDRNVSVVGSMPKTDLTKNIEVESLRRKEETICLNVADTKLAAEAARFIHTRDIGTAKRWRNRMFLWNTVKHIPVNERMDNPFQRGNVCEDPERCQELEKKGGNPNESICPQCPVYTACKEQGYLSQHTTLETAKVHIVDDDQLCLHPQYAKTVEQLLDAHGEKQLLFIVNTSREHRLFLKCELPKTVLDEWVTNWQGEALGNFALVLLNALNFRDKSHVNFVRRLRTAIQTFEWLEKEIVKQMCNVRVRGRVTARRVMNKETGEELARFTIEFEGGISAYVPLDAACADIMESQKIPFYQLNTFVPDENINILMPIADAIRLGILDATTVDSIQEFPTVCRDSNWTFWHQLKRFFEYYVGDTDAPIHWEDEVLRFCVPPVLHPGVKHLLVTAPLLSPKHLRRVFSDSEIEILNMQAMELVPGNRVFQIRTDTYPQKTIVDTNNTWDVYGFSDIGQDIFWRIQAEIERDPNIKHGIIAHHHAVDQLTDLESYENVSFLTIFRKTEGLENSFQEAQVIWIVGLPDTGSRDILRRSQILFGNHEEPLSYEMEPKSFHYKDERVQSVYEMTIFHVFREIIEMAQLNRIGNKKIMMITGLRIPYITDRPETLLFDWADLEIAGGLDKLTEAITTRQRFETARENLTAESHRKTVEAVLGCSPRQASRVLQRLRGGKLARVPFREQIIALLADGEKKTREITDSIEGNPKAINTELTRLVNKGAIVKVKRGVYTLPKT